MRHSEPAFVRGQAGALERHRVKRHRGQSGARSLKWSSPTLESEQQED